MICALSSFGFGNKCFMLGGGVKGGGRELKVSLTI